MLYLRLDKLASLEAVTLNSLSAIGAETTLGLKLLGTDASIQAHSRAIPVRCT